MVRPQRNKFYIHITLCGGDISFALILTGSQKREKTGIHWFYHVIMLWFILNWIKHLYRNDCFRTTLIMDRKVEEKCGRYFCRIGLARIRFPSLFKKEMINTFYSLSNKAINLYNKQAVIKRNNMHIIHREIVYQQCHPSVITPYSKFHLHGWWCNTSSYLHYYCKSLRDWGLPYNGIS